MVNKNTIEIDVKRYEELLQKETLLVTIVRLVRKGLGWSTIQGLLDEEVADE